MTVHDEPEPIDLRLRSPLDIDGDSGTGTDCEDLEDDITHAERERSFKDSVHGWSACFLFTLISR